MHEGIALPTVGNYLACTHLPDAFGLCCFGVQIAHTVKVAMTPYQAVIYAWVVHTGTLRSDPEAPAVGNMRRPYVTLNNKCMELRKVSTCDFAAAPRCMDVSTACMASTGVMHVSACYVLLVCALHADPTMELSLPVMHL